MSNTWWYQAFISPITSLNADLVLAAVTRHGYSLRNPDTNQIHIERVIPEPLQQESLRVDAVDDLTVQLSKPGSLLSIWKDDIDVSLGFDITGEGEAWSIRTFDLHDRPAFGRISMGVGQSAFAADEPRRFDVSRDVFHMYVDLCSALKAHYGYSADEDVLEFYIRQLHTHEEIKARRRPSVLFWLNYFSNEYVSAIGLRSIEQVGARIVEVESGYLATFAEHPWQADIRTLELINHAWQTMPR